MKKITKTTSTSRRGKTTVKITKIIEEEVGAAPAAKTKTSPKTKAAESQAPAPKRTVVHAHYLLDDSGSMTDCYSQAVTKVNELIEQLRVESARTGIETYVTVWLFSDRVVKIVEGPVARVGNLSYNFHRGGLTYIREAVCDAIEVASTIKDASSENTLFLLNCITDGAQNGKRGINSIYTSGKIWTDTQLKQLISGTQATGRWTLTFMVPDAAGKSALLGMGIPGDNIALWENTAAGAEAAFTQTSRATTAYYDNVTRGVTSTTKFYATTDASKITSTDLAKMEDVSDRFQTLKVPHEVELQAFIEGKGKTFYLGAGYYPVTKREKLRAGRNVLIRAKDTRRVYAGAQARQLLGLADGEVIVTPGNHANFDIFFQSTSRNRHLVNGTELLWDKTKTSDDAETWDSAGAKAAADAKKAQADAGA